jgi:hypothetical protein
MTALQIIGLVVFIVVITGILGYLFQAGKENIVGGQEQYITPEHTKEELDNIKLVEELYNKDLRPVVVEKTKPKATPKQLNVTEPEFLPKQSKPEFPIDKPKKKRKYHPKVKN